MIPKDKPEKYPSKISVLMTYCELLTYSLGFFTLYSKNFCKAWNYPKLQCLYSFVESHQG